MEVIRLYPECVKCLLSKQLDRCPQEVSLDKKVEYMQKVLQLVADAPKNTSAPVLVRGMYDLQKEMFGIYADYTKVKSYFNKMMLGLEEELWEKIRQDKESLKRAVQYAMIGNYIDFAALKDVDEKTLLEFLNKAENENVSEEELENLNREIIASKEMVYILDNCGEVVMDKLFMRLMKIMNPKLRITAMVRGGSVMNDVTRLDATEVGLEEIADIADSGTNIAGAPLDMISDEALNILEKADFIIAKGQGNFETMHQCKKNIYYIFMCKCTMFEKRFSLPKYSGVLVSEKNI